MKKPLIISGDKGKTKLAKMISEISGEYIYIESHNLDSIKGISENCKTIILDRVSPEKIKKIVTGDFSFRKIYTDTFIKLSDYNLIFITNEKLDDSLLKRVNHHII
jgi:hypothetical protein